MNKKIRSLGKIIFKQHRSFNVCAVLLVFFIMLFAGTLSFIAIQVFRLLGHFPSKFEAPLVLMLIFLTVSAIIGTLISAAVTSSILKPINKMKQAMKKVEKGDFSVSVDRSETYGEVDSLIASFNRMVEELNGIEMFREDFINSFSHEFKTPIVSIQGFARQLKKENLSPEKRSEYIDIIISESKRLTKLSSNILLLNKFENQQYITDQSDFYLDEQIRNCILLLEKQWSKKNIDFDISLEPIPFHSNQDMLSQAWVNILSNSIKFSPENTTISVRSSVRGGKIRIDITDHGEGMDEETLHHIFERFYQGDSAHSSEGNGLGLPLVKRIIELCSGAIRVESQKGKGTVFSVFFSLPKNEKE